MIRFERAFRHVIEALLKNAQALAQLFYFQHHAGVAVRDATPGRDFEVEVFIARVRTPFTHVEVDTGGAQACAGGAPLQRLFGGIGCHADGTAFQNGVAQGGLLIGVQTLRHPLEELTQQAIPATRQIVRDAADAEPRRVHTEPGNRFHQIVNFLPIGKGEEDRRHRADVLNKGRDIQQVAVDAEQLGEHHADHVHAIRYGDPSQFFHRQHVRHLVDAAAEIFNTVGIRDVAVPGLTLAHLLGAAVVITDIRYAVDDLFAVQLQNNAERTMRRWVVRTEVEEHEVLVVGAALHAPLFRFKGQRLHLQILFGFGQLKRVELGGARRIIFTQRVTFPGRRHHDATQVRVTIEGNAKHFPGFTLIPVGVGEQFGEGRQMQIVFRQRHLEHDVAVAIDGDQVIENGKIRGGQAIAVRAQTFVHAVQVKQHHVRLRQFLQEITHLQQLFTLHPYHRYAGTGWLNGKGIRPKAVAQFANHRVIKVIAGLPGWCGVMRG